MQTDKQTDRQTHTQTHRGTDTHWHTLTHIDTHWHTLTQIDTHWHYITLPYITLHYIHTYTNTHTNTHIHTHTHTYTHTWQTVCRLWVTSCFPSGGSGYSSLRPFSAKKWNCSVRKNCKTGFCCVHTDEKQSLTETEWNDGKTAGTWSWSDSIS